MNDISSVSLELNSEDVEAKALQNISARTNVLKDFVRNVSILKWHVLQSKKGSPLIPFDKQCSGSQYFLMET